MNSDALSEPNVERGQRNAEPKLPPAPASNGGAQAVDALSALESEFHLAPNELRLEDASPSLHAIGQTPLLPPREPLGARVANIIARHHTLLLALCTVLLWAIITMPALWQRDAYRPGMIVQEDIVAPHDAWLLDHDATKARKEEAATLVPPVYSPNPVAQAEALSQLRSIMLAARRATATTALAPGPVVTVADPARQDAARVQRLNAQLTHSLPPKVARRLLALPAGRWGAVERAAKDAVRAVYVRGQIRSDVKDDLKIMARGRIRQAIRQAGAGLKLSAAEAIVADDLAQHVARQPNMVFNERQTELAQEGASEQVREVYEKIEANATLVKAGEKITEEQWAQLQELELPGVAPRLDLNTALARLGLCVMLVIFAASYLARFHPGLIEQPAALWLAATVPILFLFFFRLIKGVPHADFMMVPLAATAAMLLTVLLNARVGIVAGFIVAALCSVMARVDIGMLLVAALSAWIGTLSVADIASRGQLVRAAIVLALTNAVLIASHSVLQNGPADEVMSSAATGALAGVGSILAMAGLAVFLERPFGITTHLRLLELMSPDELVMRRMQAEAPGTYTHSLMVAMLGETAAKAVGADPLLCRVGGLYHDIGKLRRPHCFVENQSGENIHDRLSPQLSALIILAHVKDGLELGRALRLPQPVLEIIAQHHGTTLLSYFYVRAVQTNLAQTNLAQGSPRDSADDGAGEARTGEARNGGTSVEGSRQEGSRALPDEKMFRYAGPRPQSKESAIVMLADTIEASSRALPNLTPERLNEHIKTMIGQRLQEGELSECELTLRDLGTIENTFTHVLRGVLHQRIEYPEPGRELDTQSNADALNWMHETLAQAARDPDERRAGAGDRRRSARAQVREQRNREDNGAENEPVNGPEHRQDTPPGNAPANRSARRRDLRQLKRAARLDDSPRYHPQPETSEPPANTPDFAPSPSADDTSEPTSISTQPPIGAQPATAARESQRDMVALREPSAAGDIPRHRRTTNGKH